MGEEAWIQALSRGDMDWFPELVEAYSGRIWALSVRMLGGVSDAEDLTQEIFMLLYAKLPQFKGESQLSTWVYRVAVNCAHSYRRKNAPLARWLRGEEALLAQKPSPSPPNDQRLLTDERNKELYRALGRLHQHDREIIELFYFQQMSCQRIAEILLIAPRSVETRLYRARKRLQKAMGIDEKTEEEPDVRFEETAGHISRA